MDEEQTGDVDPTGAYITMENGVVDRQRSGFINGIPDSIDEDDPISFEECDDVIATVLEMADWDPERAVDLMMYGAAIFAVECIPSEDMRGMVLDSMTASLGRAFAVYSSLKIGPKECLYEPIDFDHEDGCGRWGPGNNFHGGA